MALALHRGGETFEGQVTIKFSLCHDFQNSDNIYADYKGEKVTRIDVNGSRITDKGVYRDHKIYFPSEYLKEGVNTVRINFVSKYSKDCQGTTWFKDKDDGEEYIYSDSEPAN